MGDLDSLVAEAKNRISELISKPKMSEKLLSKPPFRFLFDTIAAITSATGFGEGLFSGEELDFSTMTDKNAKCAYLDKIFLLVGICKVFLQVMIVLSITCFLQKLICRVLTCGCSQSM